MTKKFGVFVYFLANIYLLIYYFLQLLKLYSDKYSYDSMIYVYPIATADGLFIISLMYLVFGKEFTKYIGLLLALAVAHNVAVAGSVKMIPVAGFAVAITSIIVATSFVRKQKI
ncbi:hypothetical protein SAMN05421788_106300 [Filimonas lacunae]|uniref:Uncharacterized protein n=1 Tax=Filimonas lacunae TaxID=477680 RepID=A0A173MF53_9BACT|nr:hypothetical protein [Filimonas lacunae]BAV06233.1 hypothetical protein FLA_2249 [Filimonas lacunae]SIT25383.1 hypothetical protein SAMN05421788_106300 [Filimonas lacunae]